jgi:hypothetical protein
MHQRVDLLRFCIARGALLRHGVHGGPARPRPTVHRKRALQVGRLLRWLLLQDVRDDGRVRLRIHLFEPPVHQLRGRALPADLRSRRRRGPLLGLLPNARLGRRDVGDGVRPEIAAQGHVQGERGLPGRRLRAGRLHARGRIPQRRIVHGGRRLPIEDVHLRLLPRRRSGRRCVHDVVRLSRRQVLHVGAQRRQMRTELLTHRGR